MTESPLTSQFSPSNAGTIDTLSKELARDETVSLGASTWEASLATKPPFQAPLARIVTAEFRRAVWEETKEDVRHVNWKRFRKRSWHCFIKLCIALAAIAPLVGLMLFVMLSNIVLTTAALDATSNGDALNVCLPNGDFDVSDSGYSAMSSDNFFQITLGFGSLAFSHAKMIDILFDIVAGRGGQILLGLVSYRVYTCALLRMMEHDAISYGTFEAITLRPDSWVALWKLSQDFFHNNGIRARCTVAWLITSALFIVAYPTLISAMSGYSANVEAFVSVQSNMIPFSDFRIVRYIIHDGWRLGLTGDYLVTVVPGDKQASLRSDSSFALDQCLVYGPWSKHYTSETYTSSGYITDVSYIYDWSSVPPDCQLAWAISNYTYAFGFNGDNPSKSNFTINGTAISLPSPSLNITAASSVNQTAYYCDGAFYLDAPADFNYVDCMYSPSWSVFGFGEFDTYRGPVLWTIPSSNTTYDEAFMQSNGTCQQLATYKWGFSALMFFCFTIILSIWSIGTYAVWLDAYLHSRLLRAGKTMGKNRAMLDFAAAMRKDIGMNEAEHASEAELARLLSKNRARYRVRLGEPNEHTLPQSRWRDVQEWWRGVSLRQWAYAEKWWLVVLLLSMIFTTTFLGKIGGCLIVAGVVWTLALGRTVRSRWLVFAAFFVVAIPFCFVFVGE